MRPGRRGSVSARVFFAGILVGGLLRLMGAPLPGTIDVRVFKGWGLAALDRGINTVYSADTSGAAVPPYFLKVTYPPLAVYTLAAAAAAYRWIPSPPRAAWVYTVLLKLPVLLAELLAALVAARYVRRWDDDDQGRAVFLVYWLNPAVVVSGSFLGYQDGLYIVWSFIAVVAATRNRPALAGAAFMVAVMYKQLALFYAPVLVVLLLRQEPARRAAAAVGAALVVGSVVLAPFWVQGQALIVVRQVVAASVYPELSGTAVNPWWLVSFGFQSLDGWRDGLSLAYALSREVRISSRHVEACRVLGLVAYTAFTTWHLRALWKDRSEPGALLAAGVQFYAYTMFFTGVHENHALGALVFLAALAPSGHRPRLLCLLVSFVTFANLAVVYGLGLGPLFPRMVFGFDLTMALALLNVTVFVWMCSWAIRPGSPGSSLTATAVRDGSIQPRVGG